MIYFITGSCGVGKTSVLRELKAALPKEKFAFHDLDERGFKSTKDWREGELKFFKAQAETDLKNGISTFISGFSRPSEVFDNTDDNNQIIMVLLHASPEVIKFRIFGRYSTKESQQIFFEKHNKTVEEFAQANADYVLTLKNDFEKFPIEIINTDNLSLIEVVEKIIKLIN